MSYLIVFLDAVEEFYSGGGQFKMLNSNMESFRDDSIPDLLVDNNTN